MQIGICWLYCVSYVCGRHLRMRYVFYLCVITYNIFLSHTMCNSLYLIECVPEAWFYVQAMINVPFEVEGKINERNRKIKYFQPQRSFLLIRWIFVYTLLVFVKLILNQTSKYS